MSLRTSLMPIIEKHRMKFDDFGFRQFDVAMRTVEWSGESVGKGVLTVIEYPITISGKRPAVKLLSTEDVIASGGEYTDVDYRIGPFTPKFVDGGIEIDEFEPEKSDTSRKMIFYKLTGPGMENGAWFKKISQEVHRNLSFIFTIRKTAKVPSDITP
jgi:hypothetical protein